MSETRLSRDGQEVMAEMALGKGLQAFWGAPLEGGRGTGGIWDCSHGGVGILVKKGWAAKAAARVPGDLLTTQLWESTRWLHVHLAHGKGKNVLNIQVVYGVSGNPRENSVFWDKVVAYTGRLGGVPNIIVGDFNFLLGGGGGYQNP